MSKLNVANTLTNAFGSGKIKVKEQDSDETKALLLTFFRETEHEQVQPDSGPIETATEKFEPIVEKNSKRLIIQVTTKIWTM